MKYTFREKQPWGYTEYSIQPNTYTLFYTRRAKVELFTNKYFGRMLFLDNILQSTQFDANIYDREIVQNALPEFPYSVLLVGGAEGSLAKEILSQKSVLQVVMVDWDEELVTHMKTETAYETAFTDPRLTIIHSDIKEYLEKNTTHFFDYIVLDLFDPFTDDDIEFLCDICKKCLKYECNISMNAGGDLKIVERIICKLQGEKETFAISYKKVFIPSYQEYWYLISLCKI